MPLEIHFGWCVTSSVIFHFSTVERKVGTDRPLLYYNTHPRVICNFSYRRIFCARKIHYSAGENTHTDPLLKPQKRERLSTFQNNLSLFFSTGETKACNFTVCEVRSKNTTNTNTSCQNDH